MYILPDHAVLPPVVELLRMNLSIQTDISLLHHFWNSLFLSFHFEKLPCYFAETPAVQVYTVRASVMAPPPCPPTSPSRPPPPPPTGSSSTPCSEHYCISEEILQRNLQLNMTAAAMARL